MLNSERIFSDSRTLNAIEDTFFRRAMAIYCENESKKVMSELEASDTEPKCNAAPVSRIFAKLRRQSGFSNAFRIAKKITDRVALFVLAVVIIFVGAVTASADVRSSLAEFTSRWGTFTNIAEEPFDLDGEDVKSFTVEYATGWNFDSEGTKNILNGENLFGGEVICASSRYYINYYVDMNGYGPTICNDNTYSISYNDSEPYPIKGIIAEDEFGETVFYPYYNESGSNLYMVCKRDETAEEIFKESSELTLPDGTTVKVQPFCINIWCLDSENSDGTSKATTMSDFSSEGHKYVEAEISFKDITVWPFCDGEGEEIWGTRAYGSFHLDNVNILNRF